MNFGGVLIGKKQNKKQFYLSFATTNLKYISVILEVRVPGSISYYHLHLSHFVSSK
jgi:hypothetical protein